MQPQNYNAQHRSIKQRNKTPLLESHIFQKRSGTAGIRGQLYETKLLTLILHRLLNNDNIEEFVLGTNIDGLGAMDDIVLRYKKKYPHKSKIIFLQAKHRDDTNKHKLNMEDIINKDGDFSFQKYFESYLRIKQILLNDNNSLMFRGPKEDIEHEFVIYTPVKENIPDNKLSKSSDFDNLIMTKESVFQFKCDDQDLEKFVASVRISRVSLLAKSVANFIKKDNFKKVMDNEKIKEYHIFLSRNVIAIEDEKITVLNDSFSIDKETSYCIGKFSQSFLMSSDDNLLLMKRLLCSELSNTRNALEQQGVDFLKAIRFNLPIDFGNRIFRFNGIKEKRQKRLNHMCFIFHKLLQHVNDQGFEVKLDNNSIGSDKAIQREWLGKYWLGALVGNLLINDGETETLKFNLIEQSLSTDNVKILQHLREHYDLSKLRFNINIDGFPKLILFSTNHDRELVRYFLSNLKFYTNQAQENEVEDIIKNEIKSCYVQQKLQNSLSNIKCEVIYLKVHNEIQKWWKQTPSAPYLTETCRYYKQAEREILENSLLSFINLINRNELKKMFIEFNSTAITSLLVDGFLQKDDKVLIILSDEINFSSKKLIQYFDNIMTDMDCIFIDLDAILIKNSLDILKHELLLAINPVLVLTTKDQRNTSDLCQIMKELIEVFKGQIIIIADSSFEQNFKTVFADNIIQKDINNFSDLSSNTSNITLESKVLFQGVGVTVNTVFNHDCLTLFSSRLLRQLIYNENIELGKSLVNNVYSKTSDFFVDRSLCRYVTLNIDKFKDTFRYLVDGKNENLVVQYKNDIIIITESESMFENTCKINNESNIHWFLKKENHKDLIWKKTQGSLQTLIKYVNNDLHKDFMLSANTLKDIKEKVVIIRSGPGMGKSTLLSHLAINTKQSYPNLWIINVNLLDNTNQLSNWKTKKTNIDLIEAFKFLCSLTINKEVLKNVDDFETLLSKLISANGDQIYFIDSEDKSLPDLDLTEVKLLIHFYNYNSLAVLVDGFDEICPDFSNEINQLLCTLKTSKIAHLWITSRPCNMLNQLELTLMTFSFCLNSLTSMEQKKVLHNIWSKKLVACSKRNQTTVSTIYTIDHFYEYWINKRGVLKTFTSLPLHLYMIAIVFEDYYIAYLNMNTKTYMFKDATNLINLYEKFTSIKFLKIRFGEKKQTMNFKDPDMRKIIDKEYKLFLENHKSIAAYLLLDKDLLLTEYDIKNVEEFLKNLKLSDEKSDIIESIIDNHPKFVHYTFAEYYAVEHIFDKLKSLDITCVAYFLNHLLVYDKFMGIRRFINSKLERNKDIVTYLQSSEAFRSIVFNTLSAQNISFKKTALVVNMKEDLEITVEFLLKSAESFINKDNLSDFLKGIQTKQHCVICDAIKHGKESTVYNFMKLVQDIDTKKFKDLFHCLTTLKRGSYTIFPWMKSTLLTILIKGNYDLNLLFAILTSQFKFGFFAPAHSLATDLYNIKSIWESLKYISKTQLFKIFSIRDNDGHTPFHYSALQNNYNFFTTAYELLGKEVFKKICLMQDNLNFTAVCLFAYDERYFSELKILIEIVYEEPDVNIKDFIFNKLPKLHPKDISQYWHDIFNFQFPSTIDTAGLIMSKWGSIGLNPDSWRYVYSTKSSQLPIGVHAITPFLDTLIGRHIFAFSF